MCLKQVCGSVILNALVSVLSFVQTHHKILRVKESHRIAGAGKDALPRRASSPTTHH